MLQPAQSGLTRRHLAHNFAGDRLGDKNARFSRYIANPSQPNTAFPSSVLEFPRSNAPRTSDRPRTMQPADANLLHKSNYAHFPSGFCHQLCRRIRADWPTPTPRLHRSSTARNTKRSPPLRDLLLRRLNLVHGLEDVLALDEHLHAERSEERRVGKECRL